ncbi:UNVERIFIED_CONTAM: hypothetical protein GTU68_024531 [Idotea baltica]|nr:hypothetical protein [Idotea baltica]
MRQVFAGASAAATVPIPQRQRSLGRRRNL